MPRPVNPNLQTDLLDAAIALLESKGPAFSMRDLSRAIGYSTTAVYRCFANRADLLRAMQLRLFEELSVDLMRPATPGPLVPQITALGAAFVSWGVANPVRYEFMFHNAQPEASLDAAERQLVMSPLWALEALLEAAVATGELVELDPKTVALMMFSSVHGLVSLHLAHRLEGAASEGPVAVYGDWVRLFLAAR
jgi:AcrR family transcriptional regulator